MAMSLRKANRYLRAFGRFKVPLIGHLGARILRRDDAATVVRIPLRRRSRNHWGTMYFGALAVGADVAAGWPAMEAAMEAKRRDGVDVGLVFKASRAEYLRRPDGHVHFKCRDVGEIRDLVERAVRSGKREEMDVEVTATVPSSGNDDPVARFVMTLSLKALGSRAAKS